MFYSLIDKFMTKFIGVSWKTSLFGILAFFAGTAEIWQDYLKDCGLQPSWTRALTLVFTLLAFLFAKDKQVTGGSIQNVTPPKP